MLLTPALVGCFFSKTAGNDRPIQTYNPVALRAESSSIALPIKLEAAQLSARANEALPKRIVDIDWTNVNACVPKTYHNVCTLRGPNPRKPWETICIGRLARVEASPQIDCRYSAKVDRAALSLEATNGGLTANLPIKIRGKVEGRGEIGRSIRLEPRGDMDLKFRAALDVSPEYTLVGTTNLDYEWSDFAHVWMAGIKVRVDEEANKKIDEKLEEFMPEVADRIAQADLRSPIEKAWRAGFESFELADETYLRLTPQAIAMASPTADNGTLIINFGTRLVAESFVGTERPAAGTPTTLPPLMKTPFEPGISLSLPVRIAFDRFAEELRRGFDAGEWQRVNVDGLGVVKYKVLDARIFQTEGQKAVLGLKMQVDAPKRWLDAKGWIWTTTGIAIDNTQRVVRLESPHFRGDTSNWALDALLKVANFGSVNQRIVESSEVNFSVEHDALLEEGNRVLNRPLDDLLFLSGSLDAVSLGKAEVASDALVIPIKARGRAEISTAISTGR